jgi:H/ACA ribonucleoprotein complex non-core subunit NAF1
LELVLSDSSDSDSSHTNSSSTTDDSESKSENDSEDESDSSSESDDSLPARDEDESDGEEEATRKRVKAKKRLDKMVRDDAADSGSEDGTTGNRPSFATVHEIVSPSVSTPSIVEVPDTELIELIGEVLSIVDSVVVVKSSEHGMQRVLDTDSLLVFEDRKVLGLVSHFFPDTSVCV